MLNTENGHIGELISLGGIKSANGQGRVMQGFVGTIATRRQIVEANPKRIALILCNQGSVNLYLYFGYVNDPYAEIVVKPGATFQIDENLPWTGFIEAYAAASCSLSGFEVSVP